MRVLLNRGGGEVIVVMISVTRRMYILYFWESMEDRTIENEGKRSSNKKDKRK